ncbi:1,2-dihydroxy-3-keto-5-methylthiopentene dioxygenase [Crossiella equi]|uniref:Acireductone dioxygenase n=1 Tax=Crossiella equi TaxID=130796 RepID=A0ABS5ABX1_9PSEU|nr:cupin [Crossiella equi]MBP2474076.1 1,2-dihydroxy-3-keto-5-methylthiopentene dioxygenase [Crossiella equi]
MTLLQVMPENSPATVELRTRDSEKIAAVLAELGVEYEQWDTVDLPLKAGQDEVLAAYSAQVEELKAKGGFRLVDVAALRPDPSDETYPARAAKARGTFLDEHRHSENEVRFFVAGQGCFYLHLNSRVYAVVCEAGDLLSVPAGTTHWFDMGPVPDFVAIRFFEEEDGWVGDFTGDPIAAGFPRLDELVAEPAA